MRVTAHLVGDIKVFCTLGLIILEFVCLLAIYCRLLYLCLVSVIDYALRLSNMELCHGDLSGLFKF